VDVAFVDKLIPFYMQEQAIVDIYVKSLQNIIKVPAKALSFYNKKDGVWILKDGNVVEFKAVNILARDDNSFATKDLSAKDIVVIPDPKKKTLKNGMKIYIK